MFKRADAYVTPIILSHVDKYIKNFQSHAQSLSLWEGALALHNLELRTDIIQEELNLPFHLSSGTIHELIIQVPWMKIMSEPIMVTINTIECVLTLKTEPSTEPRPHVDRQIKKEVLEAPATYVQSLVNRVVNNISFRCNNLILKYVEEDIVLSVNIKHLSMDSVNGKWEPSFSDMTVEDLHVRKKIKLSDLTICLDKRNSSGRIDNFMKPLLYRCETEIRMDRAYYNLTNPNPKYIRCFISSPQLDIVISSQQIPMLMRIANLFWALKKKQLKLSSKMDISANQHTAGASKSSKSNQDIQPNAGSPHEDSWTGWALSFMMPIVYYVDDDAEPRDQKAEPVLLFGISFDKINVTFEVIENGESRSIIGNNRDNTKHELFFIEMTSMLYESSIRSQRFCMRVGLGGFNLSLHNPGLCQNPAEDCKIKYISSVEIVEYSDRDEVGEINEADEPILPSAPALWPVEEDDLSIVEAMSDEEMSTVCPTISFSYLYTIDLPEDYDHSVELSADLEYSNLNESASMNIVFGPINYLLCAGLMHRISIITKAANTYDYAPYFKVKPLLLKHELPPTKTDDFDAMICFIPQTKIRIYMEKQKLSVASWSHLQNPPPENINQNAVGRRKPETTVPSNYQECCKNRKKVPHVVFEAEDVEMTIVKPMYPNRLTYIACQLPDPPISMFEACHTDYSIKVYNLECSLYREGTKKEKKEKPDEEEKEEVEKKRKMTKDPKKNDEIAELFSPIITDCSFQLKMKNLILPEYWDNDLSIIYDDFMFTIDTMTVCASMPKLLTLYHILQSAANKKRNLAPLCGTTLIEDIENEMVHLEVNFEGVLLRSIYLTDLETHCLHINSIKAFAIKLPQAPPYDDAQTVWVFSASEHPANNPENNPESNPENNSENNPENNPGNNADKNLDTNPEIAPENESLPFFRGVLQMSDGTLFHPFLCTEVDPFTFVLDPLFCEWLTYRYSTEIPDEFVYSPEDSFPAPMEKTPKRSLEEMVKFGKSSSKGSFHKQSSPQSHSDREKDYVHAASSAPSSSRDVTNLIPAVEKKEYESDSWGDYLVCKIFAYGHIPVFFNFENVSVFLPTRSLSAINCQTVEEAMVRGVSQDTFSGMESILVLNIPNIFFKSTLLRNQILPYTVHGFPTAIPEKIWTTGSRSYPWSLQAKDYSVHTLSRNHLGTYAHEWVLKPTSTMVILSLIMKKKDISASLHNSSRTVIFQDGPEPPPEEPRTKSQKKKDKKKNKAKVPNLPDKPADKPDDSPIGKPKKVKVPIRPPSGIASLNVFLHTDTGNLRISLNRKQICTVIAIGHGIQELSSAIVENIQRMNMISPNGKLIKGKRPVLNSARLNRSVSSRSNELPSCDSGVTDNSESAKAANNDEIVLTKWLQVTVSKITIKLYASTHEEEHDQTVLCTEDGTIMESEELKLRDLKLVFDAEDVTTSIDVHPEYFKLKSKIVTATIHHYIRENPLGRWKLGKFLGIVIQEREKDIEIVDTRGIKRSKEDNGFLYMTLTLARCQSVYSRWDDGIEKSTKALICPKDKYVCEAELSLGCLDVVLSGPCLLPFLIALTPAYTPLYCEALSTAHPNIIPTISNPEYWNVQNVPLLYFESHQLRIMFPGDRDKLEESTCQDTAVIQIVSTVLAPTAENPISRYIERRELYETAARDGWLGMPGGPLEDRQAQITIRGLHLCSSNWDELKLTFRKDAYELPKRENPALDWNNMDDEFDGLDPDYLTRLIDPIDIVIVLAPAMFYRTTFVTGPAVDMNILNDIGIHISTSQLKLLTSLYKEFSVLSQTIKEEMEFRKEIEDLIEKVLCETHGCPYYEYIKRYISKDEGGISVDSLTTVATCSSNPTVWNTRTNSLSDTGIASDRTASPITRQTTPLEPADTPARKALIQYYDACITMGKISFILYDDISIQSPKKDKMKSSAKNQAKNMILTNGLVYAVVQQPNIAISNHNSINHIQSSIYSANIVLGGDTPLPRLPEPSDFQYHVMETRPGLPNIFTGVPPALFTAKYFSCSRTLSTLKINLDCPIKYTVTNNRVNKLLEIHRILTSATNHQSSTTIEMFETPDDTSNEMYQSLDPNATVEEVEHQLNPLCKWFGTIAVVELTVDQTIISVKTLDESVAEVLLCFTSFVNTIENKPRIDKVTMFGLVSSMILSVAQENNDRSMVVNPWSVGFDVTASREIWRIGERPGNMPSIQCLFETDPLVCQFGLKQMSALMSIVTFWRDRFADISATLLDENADCPEEVDPDASIYFGRNSPSPYEQHYKDDLRAGAFTYIESPLSTGCQLDPYQVLLKDRYFVLCYPCPRTITQISTEDIIELDEKCKDDILCSLEYYSELDYDFITYYKFKLMDGKLVNENIPYYDQNTVMSTAWRLVMYTPAEEQTRFREREPKPRLFDRNKYLCPPRLYPRETPSAYPNFEIIGYTVQELVRTLRIDSYTSPDMLPLVQFLVKIGNAEVNMYNNSEKLKRASANQEFEDRDKRFLLDGNLPPTHSSLKLSYYFTRIRARMWQKNVGTFRIDSNISLDTLDSKDLSLYRTVLSTGIRVENWWGGYIPRLSHMSDTTKSGVKIRVGELMVRLSPDALKTLAIAVNQSDDTPDPNHCEECSSSFTPQTMYHKYMLRNDTSVALLLRQEGSKQEILIQPLSATLYAWHHAKKFPQRLSVTIQEGNWRSEKGFQIDEPGLESAKCISDANPVVLSVFVSVEATSPFHRVATFMGRLTVFNLIQHNLEIKLHQKTPGGLIRVSPIFTVKGNTQLASLFLDDTCDAVFRMHVAHSNAGWTGDIPLKQCSKSNVPWLVKVPMVHKADDISVWCRVTVDPKSGQILVTVSPIYSIRSHFPMPIEFSVKTPHTKCIIESCVLGKGSTQVLNIAGSTEVEHVITFSGGEDAKQLSTKHFTIFCNKEQLLKQQHSNNLDLATTTANIREWQGEGDKWPYTTLEDGDYKWIPLHHRYPEEVIVRLNYEIPSVDSVVVEISPWTLFCNCSGLCLSLMGEDHQEMCSLDHMAVATPPMPNLIPVFYFGVTIYDNSVQISPPLSIKTEHSEEDDGSSVVINMVKSLVIPSTKTVTILSMAHEIRNNVNVFRFSSNYVIVNQTALDLIAMPIAILVENSTKVQHPSSGLGSYLLLKNEDCPLGIPITQFCFPVEQEVVTSKDGEILTEKDYAFFICLGSSMSQLSLTCPLRVDKYANRRSLSFTIEDVSVPIVVTCTREKDQTYIAVHRDIAPQLLIQNLSDVPIAVGQAIQSNLLPPTTNDYVKKVIQECEYSDWVCQVKPGEKKYYSMPTHSLHFPDISSESAYAAREPTSQVLFAHYGSSKEMPKWSSPVNVDCDSIDQLVNLPGFTKGIKVRVENHPHSTVVTIEDITQLDISAKEIRARLDENTSRGLYNEEDIRKMYEVTGQRDAEYVKNAKLNSLSLNARPQRNPLVPDGVDIPSKVPPFLVEFLKESSAVLTLGKINLVLITKCGETLQLSPSGDIASISLYDTEIKTQVDHYDNRKSEIKLTTRRIQMDNAMFYTKKFDFPVMMIGSSQPVNDNREEPTEDDGLILSCDLGLDIWPANGTDRIEWAFTNLNVTTGPMSLYLEDKYLSVLINYLSEFGPVTNPHKCNVPGSLHAIHPSITVNVTQAIMAEMDAMAYPIWFSGSLSIKPLNLLLSLHSNIHVYIALDHSPLELSSFLRQNFMTTSFRLGHALTMHYLSEAIYRAGWVVGSLEILGCPGGLARRVGAGLRALVEEPCRGLIGNGPWGLLVGVTSGSATLLRNLTHGTVESVGMMMGSVARNLDRLSLDEEHIRLNEEARRSLPPGLPEGLYRGLRGLARSIMGGATGLVSGPISGPTMLGRVLLAALTMPISATADLLAFTSQGLLGQVGWAPQPKPFDMPLRHLLEDVEAESQAWRLRMGKGPDKLLFTCQGFATDNDSVVGLVLTTQWLVIVDIDLDRILYVWEVGGCRVVHEGEVLNIGFLPMHDRAEAQTANLWKSRMEVYVHDEQTPEGLTQGERLMRIRLTPPVSSHFVSILNIARNLQLDYGFSVI